MLQLRCNRIGRSLALPMNVALEREGKAPADLNPWCQPQDSYSNLILRLFFEFAAEDGVIVLSHTPFEMGAIVHVVRGCFLLDLERSG